MFSTRNSVIFGPDLYNYLKFTNHLKYSIYRWIRLISISEHELVFSSQGCGNGNTMCRNNRKLLTEGDDKFLSLINKC